MKEIKKRKEKNLNIEKKIFFMEIKTPPEGGAIFTLRFLPLLQFPLPLILPLLQTT